MYLLPIRYVVYRKRDNDNMLVLQLLKQLCYGLYALSFYQR